MAIKFKSLIIISLVLVFFCLAPLARSGVKPYYSGEVINYSNKIFIGTTNSGQFEFFQLEGSSLNRKLVILADDPKYNYFLDVSLSETDGRLFVYLVSKKYLYKYDISGVTTAKLVKKVTDNASDEFWGVNNADGNNIAVLASRGVVVYNPSLTVINSYNLWPSYADSIRFSGNGNYLYYTIQNKLTVKDGFYRNNVLEEDIFTREDHGRTVYSDDTRGEVFVVDDQYLRKYNLDGFLTDFKHISTVGYDVHGTKGKDHVYFSDGVGIVKSRKSDLKPLDWEWTLEKGPGNGWAMGLRAVKDGSREKVIVFNGSSILVLDDNLNLITYYEAREPDFSSREPLYLVTNISEAYPNMVIRVDGGGFAINEKIKIIFDTEVKYVNSGNDGRFQAKLIVPDVNSKNTDIKADGLDSGLSYSTSFKIR